MFASRSHTSPAHSQPDATNTAKSDANNDAPSQEALKNTEAANKDAFTSNQSVSAMTPPSGDVGEPTESLGNGTKDDVAASSVEAKDTEMVDAPPVESAKPPSPPAEPGESAADPTLDSAPNKPNDSTDPKPPTSTTELPAVADPVESTLTTASDTSTKPAEGEAEKKFAADEQATDVVASQPAVSTQVESEELISPSTSMSKMILDASHDSAAPATVDTSMTDAPSQSSAKVTRDREDDEEDEPMAKRAKTFGSGEVAAHTAQPSDTKVPVASDAMALDSPAATAPAAAPTSAEAKQALSRAATPAWLADAAANKQPLSAFHNKEIRKVLGLVKKTKHGTHFRASVKQLWPGVWDQYRGLIQRPVDISFIEQNLRDGQYITVGDFKKDVQLIEDNAVTFNGINHEVTASARATVKAIYDRMAGIPAEEPMRPVKQESKSIPTRHAEPRHPPPVKKESRPPAAAAPADKNNDPQIYALLPSGLPNIRRDSTKNDGDRPKRPIHPPKNKDIGYASKTGKSKKKPELRFCEEVLKEVKSTKHWVHNQWFLEPVDPVALNIPTYFSMIKRPMDLGTMDDKLQRGEYESAKDFKADFELIVKNCIAFNGEGHMVTGSAKELQNVFNKKWADKNNWMSKHMPPSAPPAPATAATPRGTVKDDSDEEDASETEQQDGNSAQVQELERAIEALTDRLKQEQSELDKKVFAATPDPLAIDMHRGIITHLQDQLVEKKRAQNNLLQSKKAPAAKSSNKKKAAGGTSSSNAAAKKTGGGGSAATKKTNIGGSASKKPVKRKLNDQEKEIVSDAIANLESNALDKAITIIKQDTGLKVSVSQDSFYCTCICS